MPSEKVGMARSSVAAVTGGQRKKKDTREQAYNECWGQSPEMKHCRAAGNWQLAMRGK